MRPTVRIALFASLALAACAAQRLPPPDGPNCDPVNPCLAESACGMLSGGCGTGLWNCGPCVECPAVDEAASSGTVVGRILGTNPLESSSSTVPVLGHLEAQRVDRAFDISPREVSVYVNGRRVEPESEHGLLLRKLPLGPATFRVSARGYRPLVETLIVDRCRLVHDFRLVKNASPTTCDPRQLTESQSCPAGRVWAPDQQACVEPSVCRCVEAAGCPGGTTCGDDGRCGLLVGSCQAPAADDAKPPPACPAGLVRAFEGRRPGGCIFRTSCTCGDGEPCPAGMSCGPAGLCEDL